MQQARHKDDLTLLDYYAIVTFLLFAVRDGFTGSIRYFFTVFHLDAVWFIPDLLAFGSLFIFAYDQIWVRRNPFGIFFLIAFIFSVLVSVYFMNDSLVSLFSSIKMFIPMFVGFTFFRRPITELPLVRTILLFVFFASAIGLILDPHVSFPWEGQMIDSFGIQREATKLWWQGGEIRYGGFAGDSTMAAFMVIFTYFLIFPYFGARMNAILWVIAVYAVNISTSKTASITLFLFPLFYIIRILIPSAVRQLTISKALARISFISLLIPPVSMLALGGVDLTKIDPLLFSLADRINNSWQLPFVYLNKIFPPGLFIGCGIGCFSYPMDYTSLSQYSVPVDNFYLTTLLMMGFPFVIFIVMQIYCIRFSRDRVRLMLMTMFNIYCVTIQCYGPSFATLVFGYIFSEMFALRTQTASDRRLARQLPTRGPGPSRSGVGRQFST